jgi:hypothetical protein
MAVALILLIAGLWLNGLSRRLRHMPPRRRTITVSVVVVRRRLPS